MMTLQTQLNNLTMINQNQRSSFPENDPNSLTSLQLIPRQVKLTNVIVGLANVVSIGKEIDLKGRKDTKMKLPSRRG